MMILRFFSILAVLFLVPTVRGQGNDTTFDKLAEEYIKTRDRNLLVEIQKIVDAAGDAFVMRIGQKNGVPVSVTFNPKEVAPIPGDELLDAKKSD